MTNKRVFLALLLSFSFLLTACSDADVVDEVVDEVVQEQEVTAPKVYESHTSEAGNISFQYPDNFFLLDRAEEDQRIYLSPGKIELNDHLNAFEPIEIFFKDESENEMIKGLRNKVASKIKLNNESVTSIYGDVPSDSSGNAFDIYAFIFPERKVSIIAADRYSQYTNVDLKAAARKIAETMKFE